MIKCPTCGFEDNLTGPGHTCDEVIAARDVQRERGTKPYCCRYYHDGGWWGLEIHAFDDDDAQARAAKLGNLQLLGELKATIPAKPGAGLLVRAICRIRN